MLMCTSPAEAYRRTDFDARVMGADKRELVLVCFERIDSEIGSALSAAIRSDNSAKSFALTRALAALTALQLGVDRSQPLGQSLHRLYEDARRVLLSSATTFNADQLETVKSDFAEISSAILRT